jgi:hypothetical protein
VKPQVKACLEEFGGVYGLKVGDVIEMLCRQAGILQPGVSGTGNSLLGVTTQADIPVSGTHIPGWESDPAYLPPPIVRAADQGLSGGFAQPADPLYDFHLAQDGTLTPLSDSARTASALPSDLHERVQTQAEAFNHPGEAHNWDHEGRCMICGILDLTSQTANRFEPLTRDNAPLQRQVWLDEPLPWSNPDSNPMADIEQAREQARSSRHILDCGIHFPHAFTMTGICANCGIQEEHTHQFTNHGTCVICGANEHPF